jgi:hypothetical protein
MIYSNRRLDLYADCGRVIKGNQFFSHMDWDALESLTMVPPYVPPSQYEADTGDAVVATATATSSSHVHTSAIVESNYMRSTTASIACRAQQAAAALLASSAPTKRDDATAMTVASLCASVPYTGANDIFDEF